VGLLWLALGAIALWALIRLGRQTERRGRREWRVAATLVGAAALAGGVLAIARGSWILAIGLVGAGTWLVLSSRMPGRLAPTAAHHLSDAEARAVLGVGPTADAAEINAAWRKAMARVHPDQGGTEGLAARANAARDRLLRR
jgi:hypothetical protein